MNIKDFSKRFKSLIQEVVDKVSTPSAMEELGEAACELIRKRTLLGYGVDEQGSSKRKLKKLSDPYKKQRKKNSELSGNTTSARSNLTQTGHMLESLSPQKSSKGAVTIGFDDSFAENKAEWNAEKDRPFNYLSKSEIKQIEQALSDEVAKRIKEALKKLQ